LLVVRLNFWCQRLPFEVYFNVKIPWYTENSELITCAKHAHM